MKETTTVERTFEEGDVIVMRYCQTSQLGFFSRDKHGRWKLGGRVDTWNDANMNKFLDSGRDFAYLGNALEVLP